MGFTKSHLTSSKSILVYVFSWVMLTNCSNSAIRDHQSIREQEDLKVGAERMDEYLPLLKNKNIGLLVNHTSMVSKSHLLDTLVALSIDIKKVFAPEHGFRGNEADGELIEDGIDQKTGIPVISLYGDSKKPKDEYFDNIDIVVYDIQDVGARFYTYISAMHYMMEACARNGVQMIILDRPNPNGDYVDGPIWSLDKPTYVGMHPIPVVYGMTAGELATMIKGENWLKEATELDLTVVACTSWTHSDKYALPKNPSPNLPNDQSIALYPSLCFFEGTQISIGRGTYKPFQIIGLPDSSAGNYAFTPVRIDSMSRYPKFENELCFGLDLRQTKAKRSIDLSYLLEFYANSKSKDSFFKKYFTNLAGTRELQKQIELGWSEEEIKATWKSGLENFKINRKKYLLYQDFE